MTVLLTNLPLKIVEASDVVLSYFRRWPAQERQFRYKKAVVSLNRVAGYGRKAVANPRALESQKKAAARIAELSRQFEKPLQQIGIHENAIVDLVPEERQIRAQLEMANAFFPNSFSSSLIVEAKKSIIIKEQLKKLRRSIQTNSSY